MTDMTPAGWRLVTPSEHIVGKHPSSAYEDGVHYKSEPLYTADQLKQARADVLREAAQQIKRMIGGDGEVWVHEVEGILSRMAEEMK